VTSRTAPAAGRLGRSWLIDRPEALPVGAGGLGWALVAAGLATHSGTGGPAFHLGTVAVMTVATMAPLAIPVARTVAFASPWWRARRAVVLAFAAFAGTWIALASVLHLPAELLRAAAWPGDILGGLLVAGVAAGAALDPARRRRLRNCARPSAMRDGPGADHDCARAGARAALACARLCWPAMLAMLMVPGSWWPMAALSAAGLAERATAPRARALAPVAYVATAAALVGR